MPLIWQVNQPQTMRICRDPLSYLQYLEASTVPLSVLDWRFGFGFEPQMGSHLRTANPNHQSKREADLLQPVFAFTHVRLAKWWIWELKPRPILPLHSTRLIPCSAGAMEGIAAGCEIGPICVVVQIVNNTYQKRFALALEC